MSIYPPPSQTGLIFDLDNWIITVSDDSALLAFLNSNYVKFNTSQFTTVGLLNSTTTSNKNVSGITYVNNINNYGTIPSITYLYNTTTGSGFKIRLGGDMVLGGTIQIGNITNSALSIYNTNFIGNWRCKGRNDTTNQPELDYFDFTSACEICDLQTSGVLSLGGGDERTLGAVSICSATSSSSAIVNIGASGTTTNIIGKVLVDNSSVNITNGVLTINNTDYTLAYNENPYDLLIRNTSTSLFTLTLPSTIKNYSFWVFTENFNYTISSPTYNITFGQDSALSYTMQANSSAYIYCNTSSNTFVILSSTNQQYKYPTYLYPDASSITYNSPFNGCLYFTGQNSITRSAGAGTTLNLACTLATGGVYYFESTVSINIITTGTLLTLGGQTSAVILTNNDPTTFISNFYYEQPVSTVVNGYASGTNNIIKYGTAGFHTNNTTNQVIYGYARVYGAITITGAYSYQVVNNFNVWKIC
jgi:hypothetical protein